MPISDTFSLGKHWQLWFEVTASNCPTLDAKSDGTTPCLWVAPCMIADSSLPVLSSRLGASSSSCSYPLTLNITASRTAYLTMLHCNQMVC